MNHQDFEKRVRLIEAVQRAAGKCIHVSVAAMDALEAYEESQGRRFRGFPEVLADHKAGLAP